MSDPRPTTLRIGTRGSRLARWQADHVAEMIRAHGVEVEIIVLQTGGDLDQRTEFGAMDSKGIFVKEIEEALLDGRIDLAVHSLKDLPTELPPGLRLAAVPERESPLDALASASGQTLAALPAGARVATGSLRRKAQVLSLRPDVEVVPVRGNVLTRIEKLRRGDYDATLLAVAGLHRLGLEEAVSEIFPPDQVTPPMGQGALAIETREGEWVDFFNLLDDPTARMAVESERAFIAEIGGGCKTPAGVLAEPLAEGGWRITAMLASPDGGRLMRRRIECSSRETPVALARALAEEMAAQASPEIRATLHLTVKPAKPMEVLSVVMTRPAGSDARLSEALMELGVEVIEAPAIRLTSRVEANMQRCIEELDLLRRRRGWLILPSPSAIRHFSDIRSRLAENERALEGVRVAAIGAASARQLADDGIRVDFLPPRASGASLAENLPAKAGDIVLIMGSAQTRIELQDGLRERGLDVRVLYLYDPQPDAQGLREIRRVLMERPERPLVVTSPSAVDAIIGYLETYPDVLEITRWIAIGATTGSRILQRGIRAAAVAEAEAPTAEALLEAARNLRSRM